MRFLTILLIIALTVPVCMAQVPAKGPDHPLTLREAIDMALARNPEVLLAQAQQDELDGKASRRAVQVGGIQLDRVRIRSALRDSDLIIVEIGPAIKERTPVRMEAGNGARGE